MLGGASSGAAPLGGWQHWCLTDSPCVGPACLALQHAKHGPQHRALRAAYGPRVERLRRLCRAATIAIPPNAYRAAKAGGGEAALAAALEALLAKHGLDKGSDRAATDAVRARLQLQKDLDGVRPAVSCTRDTIAVICYALLDPGWPAAGSRRVVQTPSTHVRNMRGTRALPCSSWG